MRPLALVSVSLLALGCAPAAPTPAPAPEPGPTRLEIRSAPHLALSSQWQVEVGLPAPAAVVLLAEAGGQLVRVYPNAQWPSEVRPAGVSSVGLGAAGAAPGAWVCCCACPWRPMRTGWTPSVHASVGALSNVELPKMNERMVGGRIEYRAEAAPWLSPAPVFVPTVVVAIPRAISARDVDEAIRRLSPELPRSERLDAFSALLGEGTTWGEARAR